MVKRSVPVVFVGNPPPSLDVVKALAQWRPWVDGGGDAGWKEGLLDKIYGAEGIVPVPVVISEERSLASLHSDPVIFFFTSRPVAPILRQFLDLSEDRPARWVVRLEFRSGELRVLGTWDLADDHTRRQIAQGA